MKTLPADLSGKTFRVNRGPREGQPVRVVGPKILYHVDWKLIQDLWITELENGDQYTATGEQIRAAIAETTRILSAARA